jgi:8-oxo-dGTP pyrophosphatase MutT (NUDIX family)
MIDPTGRILLMNFQDPASGRQVWVTPGGGTEPGESPGQALRRELSEETGLDALEIGPAIWSRREVFAWDGHVFAQSETLFLVGAEGFEPTMSNADPNEVGQFQGFRWWSAEELEASGVLFFPRRLPELMRRLAAEGPPSRPFDVGE